MTQYHLKYRASALQAGSTITFEADDAAAALIHAQQQAGTVSAELWDGERPLCTIERCSAETPVWRVRPMS